MRDKPAPIVAKVRNGPMTIEIHRYAEGRFGFDWKPNERAKRKRIRCRSQESAEAKAKKLIGVIAAHKLDIDNLDRELLARFLRWEASHTHPTMSVEQAVKDFIASKHGKGLSVGHLSALDELEDFARAHPGDVHEIKRPDVEAWIARGGVAAGTSNHRLGRIKALINFAREQGWIGAQLLPVESIDKITVRHKRECYSPDELKAILRVCRERELIFVAIGAFLGLRPEEVRSDPSENKPSIGWQHFLWSRDKIDVPEDVAKDRRRRFVPLNDAAIAFLAPFKARKGECVPRCEPGSIRTYIRNHCADVTWIHDGLRHSYASYSMAMKPDAPALAEAMGNSVAIIRKHYLDRRHEDEAAQYFAIRPNNL